MGKLPWRLVCLHQVSLRGAEGRMEGGPFPCEEGIPSKCSPLAASVEGAAGGGGRGCQSQVKLAVSSN